MLSPWQSRRRVEMGHALDHNAALATCNIHPMVLLFEGKWLGGRMVEWGDRHGGLGPAMLARVFFLLFQCKNVVV
jgi:hypothetical protein